MCVSYSLSAPLALLLCFSSILRASVFVSGVFCMRVRFFVCLYFFLSFCFSFVLSVFLCSVFLSFFPCLRCVLVFVVCVCVLCFFVCCFFFFSLSICFFVVCWLACVVFVRLLLCLFTSLLSLLLRLSKNTNKKKRNQIYGAH